MTRRAYVMLRFNQATSEIHGWGTYSSDEGNITCSRDIRYARLAEAVGLDYEDACRKVIEVVRAWCPGLGDPS